MHGGYLWLDHKIPIDAQLIHTITCLPLEGEDPTSLFTAKHEDRQAAAIVMEMFGATKGARGIKVVKINDKCVKFGVQLLARKLLCGCHHNEVNSGVVRVVTKITWSIIDLGPPFS